MVNNMIIVLYNGLYPARQNDMHCVVVMWYISATYSSFHLVLTLQRDDLGEINLKNFNCSKRGPVIFT